MILEMSSNKKPDHRVGGVKRIRNIGKRVHKASFKGYPGLTNTALKIAEYIPSSKLYVEPFAGLGRVAKHIKSEQILLNDKSEYAYKYLQSHFYHKITNIDFAECIKKHDGPDTVFLIDPPWYFDVYKENPLSYCDRKPNEYYSILLELLINSKSHWFICCPKDKKLKGYENFYSIIVKAPQSKNYGFGLAQTKLYSNKPFQRYQQTTLVTEGSS